MNDGIEDGSNRKLINTIRKARNPGNIIRATLAGHGL
jgi:hypothetical protein